MYAPRSRPEPGERATGRSPVASRRPAGSAAQLIEAIEPCSIAFLLRQPPGEALALCPGDALREALRAVLVEPCELTAFTFEDGSAGVVATPRSGRPFDPVTASALTEGLRTRFAAVAGLRRDASPPHILPIAAVAPVEGLQENLAALDELLDTLVNGRLGAQFQPIASLATGQVCGYEALIRAPQGGALRKLGSLFDTADRARLVSWLDIACQERCFAEAARAGVRDHLFFNMDAEGLSHYHHADRSLAEKAAEHRISPRRVVLEITERQAVVDYPRLAQYIQEQREQGFLIAIDDAGAGYNSLESIANLRPDFVKIGRPLVRCIENSGPRRALLGTLVRYTTQIGASLIAEGIETWDELATVIEIGVPLGQGYLFSKPENGFRGLRRAVREFVEERGAHRRRRASGLGYGIGAMARRGVAVPPDATVEQVAHRFGKNAEVECIAVVEEERAAGLVTRDRFERDTEGRADRLQWPIARLMDPRPLALEADTPLEDAAMRVTHRREMRFQDDVLVLRDGRYAGLVPVRALLEAVTTLSANRGRHTDPVTGLPSRQPFEEALAARLAAGGPLVVARAEVRRAAPMLDIYGVQQDEELLAATARAIESALLENGGPEDMAARWGEAFWLLLGEATAGDVCARIRRAVALIAPAHEPPSASGASGWRLVLGGARTEGREIRALGDAAPHLARAMAAAEADPKGGAAIV